MLNFIKKNNKLKRQNLIDITNDFFNSTNAYEIFKIPDKLYLDYFSKLESLFNQCSFEKDNRFVTYGRLDFLREELNQRLEDEKLRYEEPNSVWGKSKWDNRMGAFIDLWDYIRGDRYIAPHQVPENMKFQDVLKANDQYYKDGYICVEEKENLLDMIKEIKSFINKKGGNLEMTDISKETVKCDKCGKESQQLVVYSVNYSLGDKESNDKLMNHNQKCPHCGYEAGRIDLSNKYNIDVDDNAPQIVYGIPDAMRKKWEEEDKKIDSNCIFDAFEGGYFGPSYYYFVNEYQNKYYFSFGYSKDGKLIQNSRGCKDLHEIQQNAEHYEKMLLEINEIVKDWKDSYNNNDIMDGTQWHLEIKKRNKKYSGSNEFPHNYNDLTKVLNKYFNADDFVPNKDKYEIDPEENMPREVYGIPDFIRNRNVDKYDVKPENNVPQRVYGVPNAMQNKYDINPENNVPQKVYGVPDFINKNTKKCPYCGSNELWKYLYGEPTYDYDKEKYVLGGCEITGNQPQYKCKKCNKDIYPEQKLIIPSELKLEKESIRVGIKNENNNYVLLLNHYNKTETYDLVFANLNNLEGKSISDLATDIAKRYSDDFVKRLSKIIEGWENSYSGNSQVSWSIKIDINGGNKLISGNGGFPSNWNELISLLSEYEIIFKNKKKVDIERIEEMKYKNMSFKELVNNRMKDPFWVETVVKYFIDEEKVNDYVAKVLFRDLMKYDDILNEFTKYLLQRTYDLKDAIEINGYTAKKISELNPSFHASGVYSFMQLLRDDFKRAEEIIKSGFANKDVIPPIMTTKTDENEKLVEKYLKEIEEEVDKEMIKQGLLTIDNGRKIPAFGSCHTRWAIEKRLLKERYNIDWQTPAEKNPFINYD